MTLLPLDKNWNHATAFSLEASVLTPKIISPVSKNPGFSSLVLRVIVASTRKLDTDPGYPMLESKNLYFVSRVPHVLNLNFPFRLK